MEKRLRRIIGGALLVLGFFSAWITEMPFDFSIFFLIPKTGPEFFGIFFSLWLAFSGLTKISMVIGWHKVWLNIISIILFFIVYFVGIVIFSDNSEPSIKFDFYQKLFGDIWIFSWIIVDIIDFIVIKKDKIIEYL